MLWASGFTTSLLTSTPGSSGVQPGRRSVVVLSATDSRRARKAQNLFAVGQRACAMKPVVPSGNNAYFLRIPDRPHDLRNGEFGSTAHNSLNLVAGAVRRDDYGEPQRTRTQRHNREPWVSRLLHSTARDYIAPPERKVEATPQRGERDFRNERGRLRLQAEAAGEWLRLCSSDTGTYEP